MEAFMNEKKASDPWLATETQAGQLYKVGEYRLTPMSKATRLRIPGTNAGLVWNRPASVVAEYSDGETVVLPILDYTRIAQVALLGAALGAAAAWLLSDAAQRRST
jgi:hypothetical protein